MAIKDRYTGKVSSSGNNRSKALNITKRSWHFNIQKVTILTKDGKKKTVKTSAKNIRTLKKKGYIA